MRVSQKGIEFLQRHEGVVLKAYRCPAGVWTIGAGLTAASGVVTPHKGMVITKEEATRLLSAAVDRKYAPAVAREMPGANQHEFDGGVSFHFNTGAIARASWVKAWRARDWRGVAERIVQWRKGGGKVLPGLERRRREELALIQKGQYRSRPAEHRLSEAYAPIVVPMSGEEITRVRDALTKLGCFPGTAYSHVLASAVIKFQRDHALTADGIIGRATLSTLQRALDARSKASTAAGVGAGGVAGEAGMQVTDMAASVPDWVFWSFLGVCSLWLAKLAWDYRDELIADWRCP